MFAYQPAALGDILLAHKSFDVLRRALCRFAAGSGGSCLALQTSALPAASASAAGDGAGYQLNLITVVRSRGRGRCRCQRLLVCCFPPRSLLYLLLYLPPSHSFSLSLIYQFLKT